MNKQKIYWLVALLIGFIIILVILSKTGLIGKDSTQKVVVEQVQLHDIIETVSASGKLYPISEIKVNPTTNGEVISLYVSEGDSVYKGQKLMTIMSTTYSGGSVSNGITEALQSLGGNSNFPVMNTAPPKAKKQRESITAPMKGVVTKLMIREGEQVGGAMQLGGSEIVRIADMSKMKVDVEVGENEIQKIKKGDTAIVEVEAYPSKKMKGLVVNISLMSSSSAMQQSLGAMASDQAANYTVSIELIAASYADIKAASQGRFPFRPGMSASVEIQTRYQLQVISVPINAVTTREDENMIKEVEEKNQKNDEIKEYVFVVDAKNKTELREVKTGVQDNEYIEILSGLKLNDKVVVAPFGAIARTLKKNMKVKIISKKELFDLNKKESEE